MNRLLAPILSILFACVFFFIAGYDIHTGHATGGTRHLHHIYYEKVDPHGFWITVSFKIALGALFIGIGIYRVMNTTIDYEFLAIPFWPQPR
jgi:hypothetical protein